MNKTMNFDLLVIGGGIGGLCAAKRAAELGVGTIGVFDANRTFGGNGRLARTYVASDFSDFGDLNTDTNAIKFFKQTMEQLHYTGNPDIIRRYLFAAKTVGQWLEARDFGWVPINFPGGPFKSDCSQNVELPNDGTGRARLGAVICDRLVAELKECEGVDMFLRSRAVKLLPDEEGNVCGAVVSTPDGYITVNAKRTILACGGVGGSFASLWEFLPKYLQPGDDLRIGGMPTCVGDGIHMAEELGAKSRVEMNIHLLGPAYAGGIFSKLYRPIMDPRGMVVNKDGGRVVDEGSMRNAQEITNRSRGKVLYQIFDQNTMEAIWAAGGPKGYALADITRDFAHEAERGWFCRAETLADAAGFIGCEASALEETVARYNGFCKAGVDSGFYKDAAHLAPVANGPYYVFYLVRDMDSTQGGICVDGDFRAVREDGSVIDKMYVIGDHVSGFVSSFYSPNGAGFTWAAVSGYLSGEMCAKALN